MPANPLLSSLVPFLALPLLFWIWWSWSSSSRPRRELLAVGLSFAVVAGLLVALGGVGLTSALRSDEGWIEAAEERYRALLDGLAGEAAVAAAELEVPVLDGESRLGAFRVLSRLGGRGGRQPGTALFLVDPDGDVLVWSGEGLRHDLPQELPRSGFDFLASTRAATVFAVQPADDSARPWRFVAGRSFDTGELPFAEPLGGPGESYRWSLGSRSDQAGGSRPQLLLEPGGGRPTMLLRVVPGEPDQELRGLLRRLAIAVLGVGMLVLSALRIVGFALLADTVVPLRGRGLRVLALTLTGTTAVGLAWGTSPLALAVLLSGIAAVGVVLLKPLRCSSWICPAVIGAGGALGLVLLAWSFQRVDGLSDLGATLGVGSSELALRLGFWAFALAVWMSTRSTRLVVPEALAWSGLLTLLLASGLQDHPLPALPLLALGGGAVGVWAAARPLRSLLGSLAALAIVAALSSAVAWETAYRMALKAHLSSTVLARLGAPEAHELEAVAAEIEGFFQNLDLSQVLPDSASGEPEGPDLALAIWLRSPLVQARALSALVVAPLAGRPQSFSFGLPVDAARGELDPQSERWPQPQLLLWAQEATLTGQAALRLNGSPWGELRYWFIPRPGFGLPGTEGEELEVELLKGEPLAQNRTPTLPGQARFALYGSGGELLFSLWPEVPTLNREVLARSGMVIEVAGTRFWSRARALPGNGPPTVGVVFLPQITLRQGLARGALHATGVLLALFLVALGVLLLASLRPAFRDLLRQNLRSYSKRLIVVYTTLLVAPLLLLNLALFRSMGDRLEEEQRNGGEAALHAARHYLGNYLPALPPGFSIDATLDDDLLTRISRMVNHEVNLYWRGYVNASSKPELFTTGLMPRRIPGEVYSRLTLLGAPVAGRTNRAGRATTYLELYAGLRLPGEPSGAGTLFLSVPLLAQQEELAAELVDITRQALLITAGLFLLLVAVGGRLARSFTTPLMQIVDGTRRIASGETSLGLAPAEPELAALVEAIDEMAERIADGRSRLVREKQVIEGMVENITAGVVSLDRSQRVLMRNRVAAELLGLEVGDPIQRVVENERLKPLAPFLSEATNGVRQSTVRLGTEGEGDREWTLVWVPVPGDGSPSALLVVEDVTEVLRGQRLEAWAEMARIIAHEIKNPLTPIRLSTEHLQRVYERHSDHFEEVFERCTGNILAQVDELQQIASEFSTYSHIPRIDPQPGDLAGTVRRVVEAYQASPPDGVDVRYEAGEELIPLPHDAKLLGRAVRNLLENALRASASGGEVLVRVARAEGEVHIVVADRGPGVQAEHLSRIFDPYFSTSSGGTGLGLPIARRIAEEHGGSVAARNRPRGGLEVTIRMPLP